MCVGGPATGALAVPGPAAPSACDADGFRISYRSAYSVPFGYAITGVTVTDLDTSACAGRILSVTLRNDDGVILSHGSVVVRPPGNTAEIEVGLHPPASSVTNADVAIG